MRNRLKTDRGRNFVPATYRGPMPGDFPIGSLESRVAMRAILDACAEEERMEEENLLVNLTPVERAQIQALNEEYVDNPLHRVWMIKLFLMARQRSIVYEQPLNLGTPEEIRHRRAVIKEIDRMTGGNAGYLENNDGLEWNRLKAIAEENLRAKKK
jgi:hypothetical protein